MRELYVADRRYKISRSFSYTVGVKVQKSTLNLDSFRWSRMSKDGVIAWAGPSIGCLQF